MLDASWREETRKSLATQCLWSFDTNRSGRAHFPFDRRYFMACRSKDFKSIMMGRQDREQYVRLLVFVSDANEVEHFSNTQLNRIEKFVFFCVCLCAFAIELEIGENMAPTFGNDGVIAVAVAVVVIVIVIIAVIWKANAQNNVDRSNSMVRRLRNRNSTFNILNEKRHAYLAVLLFSAVKNHNRLSR